MKARTTIAGSVPGGRRAAVGGAVLAILACIVLSACSAGGSTTPVITPSVTGTASFTAVPSSTPASSPAGSPSADSTTSPAASPTPTPTPSPSPTPTPSSTPTPYPTAAPSTGGGGTAGVQDVFLFGLGAGAILAGAGSIAYRRKLTRDR